MPNKTKPSVMDYEIGRELRDDLRCKLTNMPPSRPHMRWYFGGSEDVRLMKSGPLGMDAPLPQCLSEGNMQVYSPYEQAFCRHRAMVWPKRAAMVTS